MYFVRQKSQCAGCPLNHQTRVWGRGGTQFKLALIGEAPGADEDAMGEPFVGASGRVLSMGLANAGMLKHQVYLTNTTACKPPYNDLGGFEGAEAKRRCHPGLKEELEFLRREGVRVLVPLGNEALEALGITDKISKARGSVYEREGFLIVPTYHPSFIMRGQRKKNKEEGSVTSHKFVWIADLKKARELAEKGTWAPPKEDFILSPTLPQALAWIEAAIQSHNLIAVDIETTGITPDTGTTVVIGLATSGERALSIPILKKGGDHYWHNGDFLVIKEALERLFDRGGLLFQNALFDVNFLRGDGYRIDFSKVAHDTLILHHAVSPELPHTLDFIVSIYGDTPYWKGEAKERKGRILDADETELRTYNLRDAVVLHQVLHGLLADLEELGPGAKDCYYNEAIPLLGPVGEMIETGVLLDQKEVLRLKEKWNSERETLAVGLRKLGHLPKGFNLESDDDIRWFLFRVEPAKFAKIKELEEYQPREDKKPRRAGTKVHADLLRLQAIRDETQPLYRLPDYQGRKTEKGEKVAVDKQGLLGLTIALQNRLHTVLGYKADKFKVEAEAIPPLIQWIKDFQSYRAVKKLISTYTNYPTRTDGRVHTQFLEHGTVTARLASRKPNLMNIPKKRIEARNPFISRPGCKLISADYVGLEVLVLAYETNDEPLIRFLEAGGKIHDQNTKILFGLDPDHLQFPLAKRAAKIFQFGGISYGGSDKEVHEKVVLEVPELTLTMAAYKQAKERWLDAHPAYRRWSTGIRSGVHLTRRATTFLGRVRTLHGSERDIEKQALNTPIQGGAAHIINRALIRFFQERNRLGLKTKILLQVHDQLILESPLDEVDTARHLLRAEMERPVSYRDRTVSFPTETEIGTSWGALTTPDNDVEEETDEESSTV